MTLTLTSLVMQEDVDLKETSTSACEGVDSRFKAAEMLFCDLGEAVHAQQPSNVGEVK